MEEYCPLLNKMIKLVKIKEESARRLEADLEAKKRVKAEERQGKRIAWR